MRKYNSASNSLRPGQLNRITARIKDKSIVFLPYWKKGMKVECPNCKEKIKEPYKCKCGTEFEIRVKLSM